MIDHEPKTHVQNSANADVRRATIRQLNDAFRRGGCGGLVAVTPGIKALGLEALADITDAIRCFEDFNADNDPYGEHDMGTLLWRQERVFWKIDYYDVDLNLHSPDPADPEVTVRMLTVMLAWEY